MIRNIQKLSGTALIADVFILLGIFYIFGNEISVLGHSGMEPSVAYFNPVDFPLLIG
jgi:proton-coupled amino acid transporter